jgi:hypothetical protein
MPDPMAEQTLTLALLRGLRTAPSLDDDLRQALRAELRAAMAPCPWFTIGVMAPSAAEALDTLQRWQAALGWSPLVDAEPVGEAIEGPVFLKGHQANGSFWIRAETGLGQGVLLSGQHPDRPDLADTWGPLPLDLF